MIRRTLSIVFLLLTVLFAPLATADVTLVNYGEPVATDSMGACDACHVTSEQARPERQQSATEITEYKPRPNANTTEQPVRWGIKPSQHVTKVRWTPD